MPQTREHLAILDLLQVQAGVVALTKTDLVEEADWLSLIEDEVREALRGTVLEAAPILRVSARTRMGISPLIDALSVCLAACPPQPDTGRPRLPIDRVFTMTGFGTVVTGTLTGGRLEIGQEVILQPDGVRGRIRGLQSHNQKEQYALPGSRTAVNLAGVALEEVRRGAWVTLPGQFSPTQRLDLQFRLLPDVQSVAHNLEVKFFVGAAEVVGRLRLLGTEVLLPGETGWVQLELREPVIALRGDRFILRRPSPGETLGGGQVVDPHPKRRYKRFDETILAQLASLAQGTPEDILYQAILTLGAAPAQMVLVRSMLGEIPGRNALETLLAEGRVLRLEAGSPDGLITTHTYWRTLANRLQKEVGAYHKQNPLRLGIPREELKSRLKLEARLFNAGMAQMVEGEMLKADEKLVWLPDHAVKFSPAQTGTVQRLLSRFAESRFSPPSVKEVQAEVGVDVYHALIEAEQLIQVSPEVVFRQEEYAQMLEETRNMLAREGGMTVAVFRDRFQTSRKYALGFLEHLDAIGVTVREGDVRRMRR